MQSCNIEILIPVGPHDTDAMAHQRQPDPDRPNAQDTPNKRSRGHIEFESDTPDSFVDLVVATLEQSAFMDTRWAPNPSRDRRNDVLVVYEVGDTQ